MNNLVTNRGQILEETRILHIYLNQCNAFEDLIRNDMVTATCEDFGDDFEHVQVIHSYVLFIAKLRSISL